MPRLPAAILLFVAGLTAPAFVSAASCDSNIGGIKLAAGFCATVYADGLGVVRHLAVNGNGDVYAALQEVVDGKGVVALRDRHSSGHADLMQHFGDQAGTGIGIHKGYLYFATPTAVLRYRMASSGMLPVGAAETVVSGFPQQGEHAAKTITFDAAGNLYVNVGAPSNSCQEDDRVANSPGINPCPWLKEHGGVWRFNADRVGQKFPQDGQRYATGIRNAVAITWNDTVKSLYVLQMGRDQLGDNWHFTDQQNAELPAEEFFQVNQDEDFGWPYCYYDPLQHLKVQAPEYGGDGKKTGDCGKYGQPIAAFPGHWAPEAVLFYRGTTFPEHYRDGAFITFHGSWNRAPLPQAGYKVVFVPFKGDKPAGTYEIFADGFAGNEAPASPGDANYRPMGLAEGPDGALYIGDTQKGRIWRVIYTGKP